MRPALRLLPLPLSIAFGLSAMASEKPVNWNLCPATDVLPAFDEAPKADLAAAATRDQLPTDIEGDQLSGTSTIPCTRAMWRSSAATSSWAPTTCVSIPKPATTSPTATCAIRTRPSA